MNLKFNPNFKLNLLVIITLFNIPINNSSRIIILNKLRDKILIIIISIFIIIIYINLFIIKNKFINKNYFNNQKLEFIWTIIPILIIISIANISINVLYINNEIKLNSINIKILGNQWFWFYRYINLEKSFNSYIMIKNNFNFNILETDNKLIVPTNFQNLIFTSSLDVIHSWTIPRINIKIDAIPNQINSIRILINKINLLFGQCSEICGINHSFIPIIIESIKIINFIEWIK